MEMKLRNKRSHFINFYGSNKILHMQFIVLNVYGDNETLHIYCMVLNEDNKQ